MAVASGTVTTAACTNGSNTTTFSFTSTTSPLYVRVSGWFGGATISTVTFGGVGLTKVLDTGLSSGSDIATLWRLTAPTASTANIVVTLSSGTSAAGNCAAANYTGQDGVTPEGSNVNAKSAGNGTSTGSQSISGAAIGDLFIWVMANGNAAAVTPSATGGGTLVEEYDVNGASAGDREEGGRVPDAITAISCSWTGSTSWAIAGLMLKTTAASSQDTPELYGRPFGSHGQAQMQQLLSF